MATWSSSFGSMPASCRHQAAASDGNPATCLMRLKRSSSAAATSSPSITRAAAASPWKALSPRIAVTGRILVTAAGAPRSGRMPRHGGELAARAVQQLLRALQRVLVVDLDRGLVDDEGQD